MKKITSLKIDIKRNSISGILVNEENGKSESFSLQDRKAVVAKSHKKSEEGKLLFDVEHATDSSGREKVISKTPVMEDKEIAEARLVLSGFLGDEKESFDNVINSLTAIIEGKFNATEIVTEEKIEEVTKELFEDEEKIAENSDEEKAEESESSEEKSDEENSEEKIEIAEGEIVEVENVEENLTDEEKESAVKVEGEFEVVAEEKPESNKVKLRKINSKRKK